MGLNVSSTMNESNFSGEKLRKLKTLYKKKKRSPKDESLMKRLGNEKMDYLIYRAVTNNVHLFGENFQCAHLRELDLFSKKDEALFDAFVSKKLQDRDMSPDEKALFAYLGRMLMYRVCNLAKVDYVEFETFSDGEEEEEEESSEDESSEDEEEEEEESSEDENDDDWCESKSEPFDLESRLPGIHLSNGSFLHARTGNSRNGNG